MLKVKHEHLVNSNTEKTLKISVFGGLGEYLVEFGLVTLILQENLVFFDLQIISSELFDKIWIWCFLIYEYQIVICNF